MKSDLPILSVRGELRGRNIVLTGATGFLGKVVLESIVRTLPEVGRVILLIRRDDSGAAAMERFAREIAASSVFGRMRAERADALARFFGQKIECLTSDVAQPRLGLTEEAFLALAARTDLVVNLAASVNFHEPFDEALRSNAHSVENVAALARAASAPLIHVSTCYVAGYQRGEIHEALVHPARTLGARLRDGYYDVRPFIAELWHTIERLRASAMSAQELERAFVALGVREANRCGWNDAYTFTKWLGEQRALACMQGGTLTIIRPSIIESTFRAPHAGWVEGVKVADAVILAYARGKVHFFPAAADAVLDIVPADLVANAVLLAGAEALAEPSRYRFYQCCSGSNNPIRMDRFVDLVQQEATRNWRRYERLFCNAPKRPFRPMNAIAFQLVLGALRIAATLCRRLEPVLRSTHLLASTFSFYSQPRYRFHNERLLRLAQRFEMKERSDYPVDARLIDWTQYVPRHLAGLNAYALRAPDERRSTRQRVVAGAASPGRSSPSTAPASSALAGAPAS